MSDIRNELGTKLRRLLSNLVSLLANSVFLIAWILIQEALDGFVDEKSMKRATMFVFTAFRWLFSFVLFAATAMYSYKDLKRIWNEIINGSSK